MQEKLGQLPEGLERAPETGGAEPNLEESGEEKNSEKTGEMLAEELRQRLIEQFFEVAEDEITETWTERLKDASSRAKDVVRGQGEILLGGILATSRAGSAAEAFVGGKPMSALLFGTLAMISTGLIKKGWNRLETVS